MTSENTCPRCGIGFSHRQEQCERFLCGTVVTPNGDVLESEECLRRQNAALRKELAMANGVIAADDERLFKAADRVGITRSCDAAEEMADKILALRKELTASKEGMSFMLGMYTKTIKAIIDMLKVVGEKGGVAGIQWIGDWLNNCDASQGDVPEIWQAANDRLIQEAALRKERDDMKKIVEKYSQLLTKLQGLPTREDCESGVWSKWFDVGSPLDLAIDREAALSATNAADAAEKET